MKISKAATATARRLYGQCRTNDRLDDDKLRSVVSRLVETKPRDYLAILGALQKLARLEMDRRKVTVESAVELDETTRSRVIAGLARRYGPDLVAIYQVNPALLGGIRIRVGNDVYDGTVQGRLARLTAAF